VHKHCGWMTIRTSGLWNTSIPYHKGKGRILIECYLHSKSAWPATLYNLRSGSWLARANGAAAQTAGIQLHVLMDNWTCSIQPANTPLLQSTTPGLHPVSIHQMATSNYSLLLIYRPRKDDRLSWLTCSGWFTYIRGHPLTEDRAQDKESLPPKTDVLPLCQATIPRGGLLE